MFPPYKKKCVRGSECNLLCIDCGEFKCSDCIDNKSKCKPQCISLLRPFIIDQYSIAYNKCRCTSPLQEQIDGAKKTLTAKYQELKETLDQGFNRALAFLDNFAISAFPSECILNMCNQYKISKDGMTALNSVAEESKPSELIYKAKERAFNRFMERTTSLIDTMNMMAVDLSNLVNTASTVHYWNEDKLTIVDSTTMKTSTITLNKHICEQAESISFLDRVFIIGGNMTADTFEVDLFAKELISKTPMNCKKKDFGLCLNEGCFYSIGGLSGTVHMESMAECEKYSIAENKWAALPNLNVPRYYCAAFAYNCSYIYALAGFGQNSMERLAIGKPEKWETIKYTAPFTTRHGMQAIQVKYDEILVFGAYDINANNECYRIAMHEVKFTKTSNLQTGACFYNSESPIYDGKDVYAVDTNRKLHHFLMNENKWK
jgi:hypothetical protein